MSWPTWTLMYNRSRILKSHAILPGCPRPTPRAKPGFLEALWQQTAGPRVRFFFAVVEGEPGEVVGDVGFTITAPSTGDCGWFIRRQHWRCGYATEAAQLLIRQTFHEHPPRPPYRFLCHAKYRVGTRH